jgi:predicted ATPase
MANKHLLIALTGGPGGGKTTLINELSHDPAWATRLASLPEAISLTSGMGFSAHERLFQRLMVDLQMALEDGLEHALEGEERRLILCHRGSLDPLAYWLDRGWPETEFFTFTGTTREQHYQRYAAVIHLVTSADGAEQSYRRWPEAHRPETAENAIRIDQLLEQVWSGHPHYYRLDNMGKDWPEKSRQAQQILEDMWREDNR